LTFIIRDITKASIIGDCRRRSCAAFKHKGFAGMNFYSAISGMKIFSLALALASGAASAAYAAADHDTANMEVSIQIKGGCKMELSGAGNGTIDFGAVNLRSKPAHYAGIIYIQCTNDHTVNMSLDAGQHSDSAAAGSRRLMLEDSGSTCTDRTCISYNVYQGADGNRAVWGTGSDVYTVKAARFDDGDSGGKGTPAPFWIEVPITTTNIKSGTYTDNLVITMTY